MIKSENGEVTIKGSGWDVLADFSVASAVVTETLLNSGVPKRTAKDVLQKALNVGMKEAFGSSYDVANSEGYRLLVNPCIRDEIMRLKQNRLNRELLDEHDIFQKYMDIAFADMTDYVSFGRETVPVMGAFGPITVTDEKTGEKIPLMKEINAVKFRESVDVDGTLIAEIKQGKDGASIKLMDHMKAMNWLADHMDLATEEQRARIAVLKAKANVAEDEDVAADDGFLAALNGTAGEDWSDEAD